MRATLDHFDLRVANAERAAAFLERVFGWTAELEAGPANQAYRRVRASDDAAPAAGMRVGLFDGSSDVLERPLPVVRLEGETLEECLDRVVACGGRVVAEPQEIGGSGRFARFSDPDGHEWGLWTATS